jgi:hypothetical protein
MRNVSGRSCRENQSTRFVFNDRFPNSCRLCDNVGKYGRAMQATDDNIIRRMRFACWVTKATDTHSKYIILIAFPRQYWLSERASLLRYSAIPVLFFIIIIIIIIIVVMIVVVVIIIIIILITTV